MRSARPRFLVAVWAVSTSSVGIPGAGAQEVAGLLEPFGFLVTPEAGELEPPTPPLPEETLEEVQRILGDANRAIREAVERAATELPAEEVADLRGRAAALEGRPVDAMAIGPAAETLQDLSAILRPSLPIDAARLRAMAERLEAAAPGWTLAEEVAPEEGVLILRKVGAATPAVIEEGNLIALAPNESLYRVTGVDSTAGGVEVSISPAARRRFPSGAPVIVLPERVTFLAGPSVRDSEDRVTSAIGLGGSYRGVELTVGYSNTDAPGGGEDLEVRSAKVKVLLRGRLKSRHNNQLALVADTADVRSLRQRYRLLFAGNLGVDGGFCRFRCRTNLVANVGWALEEPKAGEDADDFVAVLGVSHWFRPTILFAVDYTLENDLDRQDSFSLAMTKKLSDGRITFGAAKHGALFASYVATF